jgi:hypothetical protein
VREVEKRRRRQPSAPEERVELAILERVGSLRRSDPAARHVPLEIEPGRGDHAPCGDFRAASGEAHRDQAAAKIGERRDARIQRDEVEIVEIQDGQRARRNGGPSGKRPFCLGRVGRGVREGEGDLRLAVPNELEVVDRRCRRLRGRADARHVIADDLRKAAAVGVVDTAGVAGGDRQILNIACAAQMAGHRTGAAGTRNQKCRMPNAKCRKGHRTGPSADA